MKLNCDYTGRVDDMEVHHEMPEALRSLVADECERDYCEDCMQEILEFARINMDAQTFLEDNAEKAKKAGNDAAVSPDPGEVPVEQGKQEPRAEKPEEDIKKTAQVKRGRPPKTGYQVRSGYLTGKQRETIEQMCACGMDTETISKKTGIDEKVVRKVIRNLEKE